jgi:hypothetical protein
LNFNLAGAMGRRGDRAALSFQMEDDMPENEPEVSRASRMLQLPKHPDGWTCAACKCWLKDKQYKVYILPDGTAVPEIVARAQIPLGVLANCRTSQESFCTLNPRWERAAHDHWCHQFLEWHR